MNWRNFKPAQGGNKVEKVVKPPLSTPFPTFTTFFPAKVENNELDDLPRLIADALNEIDQTRPGQWDGWRQSLPPQRREEIERTEATIDRCCLAGDRDGLLAALADYRAQCLRRDA